ncbi:hypothetical protein JQN72_02615 [Phycicoccus sp. CSK15P-2]|uniref:hypothetical protein n=1 Tax=Phycicoccus sp. CSK15P-2 TaxID=2807627 RepID=UPI001951878B|nr:hypothetical protein [Phycicoccus sp. CSK15P-2]MBM6403140.1 hypothetical protein [Phycicoccus sp. CSK15P-2]
MARATADEDLDGFVTARWSDLESVALVALLDPAAARELTTRALAGVVRRWDEHDGAPTAAAQRAVVTAVAGRRSEAVPSVPRHTVADPGDAVPGALYDALAAEPPLVRLALAADLQWELPAGRVAAVASRAGRTLTADVAAAHDRLTQAHRAAREADGLQPSDERLDPDLYLLLDRLRPEPPPDPAGLVRTGRTPVTRRAVVGAGAGAAAVGAVTWAVAASRDTTTGPAPGPTASPSPALPADDPAWDSVVSWGPRGDLAADLEVQALVARVSSGRTRLLFADDVADRRVAVTLTAQDGFVPGTLEVWHGPSGTDPRALDGPAPVLLPSEGEAPVVAVEVPDAEPPRLLVLAPPTEQGLELSTVVEPLASGDIRRTWTPAALLAGVGLPLLGSPPSFATRLRCAGHDGPVGLTDPYPGIAQSGDPVDTLVTQVALATGVQRTLLHREVVLDTRVELPLLEDGWSDAPTRVRVVLVRTPGGGVVRSVVTEGVVRPDDTELWQPAVVVPAADAREPAVVRVVDPRANTGRFLVVAPDTPAGGVRTAQLLATSPNAYPVSKVTRMREGAAVVDVVNADQAAAFRLRLEDGEGRRVFDDVPSVRPMVWDQPGWTL